MAEPEEIHTISPSPRAKQIARVKSTSPSPRAKQTARVKSNIGKIKFEKNEFESAYSFYMDAFQILRNEYGEDNLDTSIAAYNTGKCLHSLGRPNDALHFYDLFTKCIFASKDLKLLTEENILNLQCIAWDFFQHRSFENAKTFYQLALVSAMKVLGENHKVVAQILNQCGNLSFECGDVSVALRCYEKGLEIEQKLHSSRKYNHPDTIITMSNIAHAHENLGSLEKSLEFLERIIDALRSEDSTEPAASRNRGVADVLFSTARVHIKLGRLNRALETLSQVLYIQRQEFGDEHGLVATTLNEIGIIYAGQGQTLLALENFQESFKIRKALNGPNLNLSTVLFNIARIHVQNGDNDKAQECFDDLIQHGGS
jgi:hypothetical protein